MNQLIQTDEILMTAEYYAKFIEKRLNPLKFKPIAKKKKWVYRNFNVITDNNPMGKYMVPVINRLKDKAIIDKSYCTFVGDGQLEKFNDFDCKQTEFIKINDVCSSAATDKTAFLIYLDCEKASRSDEYAKQWLEVIERTLSYAAKGRYNRCIISVNLPKIPAIPNGIMSLAEREYSYFIEEYITDKTPAQKFYIDIEAMCRHSVNSGFDGINILRVDNLFGPDANCVRYFDIDSMLKSAVNEGRMTIEPKDYNAVYSFTYIRTALCAAFHILHNTKKGHVFNIKTFAASVADIKTYVQRRIKDKIGLNASAEVSDNVEYYGINDLKLRKTKFKPIINMIETLYRTTCCAAGLEHDNFNHVEIYAGKLGRIKELEIQMLADVDKICRENGIKYFLAGGTMLGAIRYGHSIPWDDDFDIGMLREDFDKFRAVCEKQLNSRYMFGSCSNKSGSHYIVDKVRLKGTYFSTNYSSIHEIEDGIFIDILVYDQTSNNPKLNMPHSKLLFCLSELIQIRWYNAPRVGFHYKLSKIALPFMRIIPFSWYHKIYERLLVVYKKKKDAKFLVDSMGKLQRKGPLPKKGLDEVQYVDYDFGFKAPIPADYTGYLTFDYGPNYLPEPNITKKVAPHNFARIDLGEYIFENRENPEFRAVNLKGELFEADKD